MGFFSFMTSDSSQSISNSSSHRGTFTVYMLDDNGHVWKEEEYEGYGVFGGKDYYQLFAEMNGLAEPSNDDDAASEDGAPDRTAGIQLWCNIDEKCNAALNKSNEHWKDIKYPFLTRNQNAKWINVRTLSCPNQGYFYIDDEEEEEEIPSLIETFCETGDIHELVKLIKEYEGEYTNKDAAEVINCYRPYKNNYIPRVEHIETMLKYFPKSKISTETMNAVRHCFPERVSVIDSLRKL